VRDDFGRTPLHDACWTSLPRFELVRYILQKEPGLLHVKDVRGHVPLNYVRKEHWDVWCDFFLQNKELLLPKNALLRPAREETNSSDHAQAELLSHATASTTSLGHD